MKYVLFLLLCFFHLDSYSQVDHAQKIVDKCIKKHGGKSYDKLGVSFTFRNIDYSIKLDKGSYTYTRSFEENGQLFLDVLNNYGFKRSINGVIQELETKEIKKYTNAINSVAYFTLIPRGLNDGAVIKKQLDDVTINGQKYHTIEVKFKEEGGGTDFNDVFMYWIHTAHFSLDYLAYSFQENDGGMRFREAINKSTKKGILFQDYVNYKPIAAGTTLSNLPEKFNEGQLFKLSEIINENIVIFK
jgi:hypothetical protein